jgi:hypothetical protein
MAGAGNLQFDHLAASLCLIDGVGFVGFFQPFAKSPLKWAWQVVGNFPAFTN